MTKKYIECYHATNMIASVFSFKSSDILSLDFNKGSMILFYDQILIL